MRTRPAGLLVMLALAVVSRLGAQDLAPVSRRTGTIRGVVYDSLLGGPLTGAMVWLDGAEGRATTDRRGQFRLQDVSVGEWPLVFSHPALDSLGLPEFRRRVAVSAGREAHADLSVPSLGTIYQFLCGELMPTIRGGRPRNGIIFGTVLDAASRRRVTGARIELAWITAHDRRPFFNRRAQTVASDSLGDYHACGLPVDQSISVAAMAGPDATGTVDVAFGPRAIARLDLLTPLDSLAGDSSGLRGRAVIIGTVIDTDTLPVDVAEATVEGGASQARTNPRGVFVLTGLPPGSRTLAVRAVGHTVIRQTVHLRHDDTLRVAVRMRRVTTLDTIHVVANKRRNMIDLMERLQRREGYALLGEQLAGPDVVSVLRALPRLRVDGPTNTGCGPAQRFITAESSCFRVLRSMAGGGCRARVLLDGRQSAEVNISRLRREDVIAVEWFPDPGFAPSRFVGYDDNCALLLVWTRQIR